MVSEKQRKILKAAGWNDARIDAAPYHESAAAIQKYLSSNPFQKTVNQPPIESVEFTPAKEYTPKPTQSNKGYHLTPEQVRYNALMAARLFEPNLKFNDGFKNLAEDIEAWMYGE